MEAIINPDRLDILLRSGSPLDETPPEIFIDNINKNLKSLRMEGKMLSTKYLLKTESPDFYKGMVAAIKAFNTISNSATMDELNQCGMDITSACCTIIKEKEKQL